MGDLKLTVMLATRDRAGVLEATLESFCGLDTSALEVKFLVVDNGSRDQTDKVLTAFAERLPLRCLHEPRSGKSRAINLGLGSLDEGDLVVFTDDDVQPRPDWLQEVAGSARRWPASDVFGGRIVPVWPEGLTLPPWLEDAWIRGFGYAEHDLGGGERPYPSGIVPLGPNFWVRRRVVAAGARFDERIGPSPRDRTMNDEIEFLERLRTGGHEPVYVPTAEVGHRIEPAAIDPAWLARRARHYGKGLARTWPLERAELHRRSPARWRAVRALALLRHGARWLGSHLRTSPRARVVQRIDALVWLAYNLESLREARR